MKKIILSALLMAVNVIGWASTTVTVNNTSNILEGCTGCSYELRLKNLTFTKAGSINWGYAELGYTNVLHGSSRTWTLNPSAGYVP